MKAAIAATAVAILVVFAIHFSTDDARPAQTTVAPQGAPLPSFKVQ